MPINGGYCVYLGNLGAIGQIPTEFCSSIEDQGPLAMKENNWECAIRGIKKADAVDVVNYFSHPRE